MYTQPPASALTLAITQGGYAPPSPAVTNFDLALGSVPVAEYSRIPGVIASFGTPWRPVPDSKESTIAAMFREAEEINIRRQLNAANAGQLLEPTIDARFQAASERSNTVRAAWDAVQPRERKNTIPLTMAPPKDIEGLDLSWRAPGSTPEVDVESSFLVKTPWKDRTATEGYASSDIYSPTWYKQLNKPTPFGAHEDGVANFDLTIPDSRYHAAVLRLGGVWADNPIQPKDRVYCAPHTDAPSRDIDDGIPWGPSGYRDTTLNFAYPDYDGPIGDPGDVVEAEQKEYYFHMNTVNVKLVSNNTPIDMQNITITLDVDSWAWKLDGTVVGLAGLALIDPGAAGPVDVEVELNGHIWVFMIESYSGSRKHADRRFTVQGVSKTQLLASPYAVQRSKVYTSSITASQVIDDEFLNSGFTASFDTTPNWTIDADALSYQDLAPLAVARRIAEAAGAIVVPSKNLAEIVIKPRFRISPWILDAEPLSSLDAQIPMAAVSSVASQYEPAPLYNAAYVSGTTYGLATLIELDGGGGTAVAPDIFDDLMTDTDVNTERARQAIAGSGSRGMITLVMPVPEFVEAPGLLEPGMVVEIVEGLESWRGYVLGTSISAPRSGAEKIEQTVNIVRFYEH